MNVYDKCIALGFVCLISAYSFERLREAKEETENPGELIVKDSGLKYRELATGNKGQPAVPGALCEIRYTVYRYVN